MLHEEVAEHLIVQVEGCVHLVEVLVPQRRGPLYVRHRDGQALAL